METWTTELARQWPLVGLLLYFIAAIQKRWWIPQSHHLEVVALKDAQCALKDAQIALLQKSHDEWKNMALKSTGLAQEAVKVAGS